MKRLIVLSGLISVAMFGCGTANHEDLKDWMREEAKSMAGKVPRLPEITPFPVVSYEAEKQLSPFSSAKILTIDSANDKTAPDHDRTRQALENFALEDLRVTGVLTDGKINYALIQTPAPNKPKHVRVGEFIGQNFGRITAINNSGLTVVETVKDTNGAWVERETRVPVPKEGDKK